MLRAQEPLKSSDKYRDLLAHTDDLEGMHMLVLQAAATEETPVRSDRRRMPIVGSSACPLYDGGPTP